MTDGLEDAEAGALELADGLRDGADEMVEQTSNSEQKAEVMSRPVDLDESNLTSVKNFGTGFAPYFMGLGLWVGALMAGFVFKPLNMRFVLSGGHPLTITLANYLPIAMFSIAQATLLMLVLQFGLKLQIDNVVGFYIFGYLTALSFAAVMQFLMAAFGFPGKFIAIIILMLQLTAAAGTFPIEMTPQFFQVIHPYMPMSYVVSGMRQIMTGIDFSVVFFDGGVLLVLGLACLALTSIVAYRKRTVRMEDFHPLLDLAIY